MKIVFIGDYGVGKTSLRRSLAGGRFKRNYLPTVGADFTFKEIMINQINYRLLIWDLAGEEKFRNIRSLYFQGVHGCLLVFDLTNRQSFDNLDNWIEDVEASTQSNGVPIWILANKKDLIVLNDGPISTLEINDYVSKIKDRYKDKFQIGFNYTSALTGENIEQSMIGLINNIMEFNNFA